MIAKDELKEQLLRLGIWEDLAYRREIRLLSLALSPGEQVTAATSGVINGRRLLIALTSQRLMFLRSGLTAAGTELNEMSLASVESATGKTGFLFGRVDLRIDGAVVTLKNLPKATVGPFLRAVADLPEKS